jgi:hypothetical protein
MEKIGLIDKILAQQNRNFESVQLLHNSDEAVRYHESLAATLLLLKEVMTYRDVNLSLNVESLVLHQELHLYANSPEEKNSIQTAITQLKDANKSLKAVQDHQGYKVAAETYPTKRIQNGLPMDSFHEFLKIHSTRLSNRMAGRLSVPEKNILRQRKELLGVVREVYMDMQRQALGLEPPTKTKGLGL